MNLNLNLRSHLLNAADPVRLARQLGMEPDPWQRDLLRSNATRILLNCSRQSGKSTIVAVLALAWALYRPGCLVLIVSPTQRQSAEVFRKVLAFYRQLGRPVDAESENQLSLTLENGSRVISAPATEVGIRTYSVDLLLIDEASRVPDEVYASVSPMVAVTKGRIVACSTPAGRRGWWYEATLSRRWKHIRVPATECPRFDAQFLADEREDLGDIAFRSEYMCEFVDAAGLAFSGDDISAIFGGVPTARVPIPVTAEPRRRPSDEEQLHIEQARMVRTLGSRVIARRKDEARRQRVCQHRWRVNADDRLCLFCGKRETFEEAS